MSMVQLRNFHGFYTIFFVVQFSNCAKCGFFPFALKLRMYQNDQQRTKIRYKQCWQYKIYSTRLILVLITYSLLLLLHTGV